MSVIAPSGATETRSGPLAPLPAALRVAGEGLPCSFYSSEWECLYDLYCENREAVRFNVQVHYEKKWSVCDIGFIHTARWQAWQLQG